MDHEVPFHTSASVPAFELPTAVQASGAAHDTPDRLPPGTAGACSMDQEVPFHASASTTAPELVS